ncbi:MAG: Sapep family Mn(2+)-dependent dipeptidase [Anaerovoracaceae bacterium]
MGIKQFLRENKESMISDIKEFVEIPTVISKPEEGAPFGRNIAQGVDWLIAKAEKLGMSTINYQGYAVEITAGKGEYMVGILGHLDVVPAGDGWKTEPFKCEEKEDALIGRGVSDDKGPLVSSLYAMKYLKENNLIPENTCVRLIAGTDEEEDWRCIEHYKENADRLPDCSIVPDGYFPAVFCEKGLVDFNLTFKDRLCSENTENINSNRLKPALITELNGGSGRNIVPGKAVCVLEGEEESLKKIADECRDYNGCSWVLRKNDGTGNNHTGHRGSLTIEMAGKSVHAMSPEKGKNAISFLIDLLGKKSELIQNREFIDTYNNFIGLDYNGGKFGCGFKDELSGELTLNIGTIRLEDGVFEMEANCRYPATMEREFIRKSIEETCKKTEFIYTEKSWLPPVYIDPESEFMEILRTTYEEISGDCENKPFAIGGATYARGIPNAVSYGPLFPWEEESAHEPNEILHVKSLELMTEIIAEALHRLLERRKK